MSSGSGVSGSTAASRARRPGRRGASARRRLAFVALAWIAGIGGRARIAGQEVEGPRGVDGPRSPPPAAAPSASEVLAGLRRFYAATSRPDGSFSPGVDPAYRGMSDAVYSDIAPITYAVIVHRTFGWELPDEERTARVLLDRQGEDGAFINRAGTVDPSSAQGRVYNTTQALVALRALGRRAERDPLPVFRAVLEDEYRRLPDYTTSFFPLAFRAHGTALDSRADARIRELLVQAEDGYIHDHIAATFHAVHYYRLVGEPTPLAERIIERTLRDQAPNGSWLRNMPSRDRHATFDAVFVLRQLGGGRENCRAAVARAARWSLGCRNLDGGFGHFPGSTSDADAIYFHVGVLVLAGLLEPVSPLPPDPDLLGWGHLFPADDRAEPTQLPPRSR